MFGHVGHSYRRRVEMAAAPTAPMGRLVRRCARPAAAAAAAAAAGGGDGEQRLDEGGFLLIGYAPVSQVAVHSVWVRCGLQEHLFAAHSQRFHGAEEGPSAGDGNKIWLWDVRYYKGAFPLFQHEQALAHHFSVLDSSPVNGRVPGLCVRLRPLAALGQLHCQSARACDVAGGVRHVGVASAFEPQPCEIHQRGTANLLHGGQPVASGSVGVTVPCVVQI
mmetsp:Transcript_8023/g.15336  ORF Transcript_8023/g.15336 Transcript_8023/m.15336 type:complete len:220 (-) Transcript_8023:1750-2409(-)